MPKAQSGAKESLQGKSKGSGSSGGADSDAPETDAQSDVRILDSRERLGDLSREDKLRLITLIEEKERRDKAKKDQYKPNEGQALVHKSTAPVRVVTSGNGSGKTTLLIQEVMCSALGYNPWLDKYTPVPSQNVIVLDSPDKVEKLWIPAIKKWFEIKPEMLKKWGRHYVTEIRLDNGSSVHFYFHQQEPLTFESVEFDGLVGFDEPPPRHCWVGLKRAGRVRGRKTRYLLAGTPISRAWVRKELVEPAMKGEISGVDVFKFGTHVNAANLSEGYIDEFSKILSEKEKRIRLHGDFFDLSGLALAHLFDRTVHVVEPFEIPKDWPCVVAIDPHPSKAHHAVLLAADHDSNIYVVDEMAEKMVAKDFSAYLHAFMEGYRVVDIVCDSLGSSEGTGGEGFYSFIQVLNRNGIRARATTFKEKNEEDFIDRIQSALIIPEFEDNFGRMVPKLRIFSHCTGTVNDIENVQWLKVKNVDENRPKLDIVHKDFLSAVKYGLATNLSIKKGDMKVFKRKKPVGAYGQRESNNLNRRIAQRLTLKPKIKSRHIKEDDDF